MQRKNLLSAIATFLILFCSVVAVAQTKVVTGNVTDEKTNLPIPNATIEVKETNYATTTDSVGNFRLNVPGNANALHVSSIGYTPKDVTITGDNMVISLTSAASGLDNVVVIAYGTRKKTDLTGAVTSISEKDFQKGAIASSEQLLQGKVAGLQITSGGGTPGGGSTIRIRTGASLNASNDPLIVIDGIPVEGNSVNGGGNILNTINPNDIESISVLKDASSTALYGSRASNGVLIITTKKGANGKLKFNFNTQVSLGEVSKYIDVFSADEIRNIVNTAQDTSFRSKLGTANTDWQKQIFQKAFGWDKNISVSGSIAKVLPFRLSYGNLNQQGVLMTDKFDRNTLDLNLSPKLLQNHLSVNVNAKYGNTKYHHADANAVNAAATFDPTQDINATNQYGGYFEWLNADGSPVGNNGNASFPNPLGLLKFRNNNETVDRFIGNIQLDYKLHWLPDLHVMVNAGTDIIHQKGSDVFDSVIVTQYNTRGRNNPYKQDKINKLLETSLFYTKDLGNSKFDILFGHSYQDFLTKVYNYPGYYLNGNIIPNTAPTFETDKPEFNLESYFARLNYTLFDRYLLTASLRRDASSKFSPQNRVGYFPAGAIAWKLKDEFFKNTPQINDLKLRFGIGLTGQQDGIGNYDYLARYKRSTNGANYIFGTDTTTLIGVYAYNPNLRWEKTLTTNFGLDYAFFNNRINGSIDIYKKKTTDLLSTIPQAPGQNYDIQVNANIGNMENKGVEFSLNTVPVKTKNLEWTLGFNITYQETKITKLLAVIDSTFKGIDVGGINGATGNKLDKHMVDYAPYKFYPYKQIYDPTTGMPIEGAYVGAPDNYYYPHNVQPSVLLGGYTQLTYKKISLGLAGHGMFGNYLYNNYASNSGTLNNILNGTVISNASKSYANTLFKNKQLYSDYYIENASFFRLDNINLGYNFGRLANNKLALRLTASVQNVFVITKYTGLDPENSSSEGIDSNIYPRPRIYSLGLNLDF